MNLSAEFEVTIWGFIAGPQHMTAITACIDCMEVLEHPLSAIAETLLCFPDTRLIHVAEPSWWDWQAQWCDGDHFLELNVEPFFGTVWKSIKLNGRCTVGHTLALWAHLLARHGGVWLCQSGPDDSYLHTPQSFLVQHAG